MREETSEVVALRTYRYLRLGIVAAIVLIVISVALEMANSSGCLQTSFSAYYYTPTRGVFVGALAAVALGMVAVQGSTEVEDAFLNLAGLLAPIVAFVPTGDANYCGVISPKGTELDELDSVAKAQEAADRLVASAHAAIDNNVTALLILVGIGLVVVPLLPIEGGWHPTLPRKGVYLLSYGLACLFWLVALVSFWVFTDGFYARAHFTSAVLLFVCIFIVVVDNALDRVADRGQAEGGWPRLKELFRRLLMAPRDRYGLVALGMVLSCVFVLTVGPSQFPDHKTLVIEALMILLFGIFWVLQTIELWWHPTRRPREQR